MLFSSPGRRRHMSTSEIDLKRCLAETALKLRSLSRPLRLEGMEFLIAAREWMRMGNLANAEIAWQNALSVFEPLWTVERYLSSTK
jgi:hypothetical protein